MSEDTELLDSQIDSTPNAIQYYGIAAPFGATCTYISKRDTNPSGWTIPQLKSLIDKYGMIMVHMPGSIYNHWMVFTGYTNGSELNDSFYVYDPYASTRAAGANLLLSQTTSGYSGTKKEDLLIVVAYN